MKLIRKILLVVGVMVLSSMLLIACSSSTKDDKDSDIIGTYYLYEEDQLDKDSYFIITSSSWTDENNDSGTYKLNGTTIIFYMPELGNEELYRGTIGNGKLEITFEGIKTTYYKEGSGPTGDEVYYTVTFKDYDGTVLQTSSVKKGETPAYNKSNPSRDNDDNYSYTFSGWQPTLTEVSEDAIYTATYTSQSLPYYVTIDLDGGTSSATKLQFKTDKISKDMLPFDVKKSGFAFKGYSLNDVKVYDENGNVVSNYQPSANMTFKAIYEESVTLTVFYTLYNPKTDQLIETFNEKPTDIGNVSETRSYNYNTYVDLFAYANEGYQFVGWYNEGQVLSNDKDYKYMMWNEDFTIEARFRYTLYDLTVWSNNNDLGQVMIRSGNSQVFYNEETLQEHYTESVTIVAYSKTDTRFLGWYNEKNELVSTNAVYTFDMLNRDYTLEAKWNSFDITYDLDGGVNNSSNPTNYNVDTQNITLFAPTKDGYTFQGWQYNGNVITQINTANICHMNLKALWTYYTLTANVNNSNAGTVSSYDNTKVTKDKSVTITAVTNAGYTFIGWYDGDNELTKELSYTFTMPTENLVYTAKWIINTNTPYKVEHYLQNIDNTYYPSTPYETDNLTGTTDTQTAGSVKRYEGFTSPSITQVNINGNGNTVIELYYTRNSYTVTLNKDIDKAGTITGAGTYKYGKKVTITAVTNAGYKFIGWYDGDNELTKELSYTFTMPTENLVYTAKWIINTNTPYKVEHYLQNIDNTYYPSTPYETDNLTGTTDTQTAGSVKRYEGFTSPSITQVNINGNGNTVIELYYTRNSYTVTLNKDIDKAGTITGAGTYKYGEEVTITALTTNEGYTFNGWYKNDKVYTDDASFDYTIGAEAVAFEARYTVNKYTITIDNQAEGVTISGITSGNGYEYDSQITLTATNIPSGYTIEWTRSDDVVKYGDTYTFKVPAGNITIITTTSVYTREGNQIYFGTYPQTKVTATTENGLLSITFDSSTWTSYRYYISSSQSDFMYYKDVDIDNNGTYDYRGVYFTQYRPYYYSSRSSIDNTYQDDNGYSTNTIYWFSYDPIEWDILTESSGKALIIANLILDSQDYYQSPASESSFSHNGGDGYANNYELSAIRKFLNDDFYNTAFNELQKAVIETTTVDNSAASTGQSSNSYACNNTNDKMFLLSYNEATTYYTIGTARQAEGSDYAKCQGLWVYSSSGNSMWWLRSPNYDYAYGVNYVSWGGSMNNNSAAVDSTRHGVRPVCWITL